MQCKESHLTKNFNVKCNQTDTEMFSSKFNVMEVTLKQHKAKGHTLSELYFAICHNEQKLTSGTLPQMRLKMAEITFRKPSMKVACGTKLTVGTFCTTNTMPKSF